MDCSTPGIPDHHQLPELTQTHVRWAGDAIQPSHPLLSPAFSAFIFPSTKVFSNDSVLCIGWPNYWSFSFSISPSNEYSGLIPFTIDCFPLRLTALISVQSKGLSRVFSNTTFQKHQSLVLSFLYGSTLWSICDYWKDLRCDCVKLCKQSNVSAF